MAGRDQDHLTEELYRQWLTPGQVMSAFGDSYYNRSNAMALLNRARLGLVRAAAEIVESAQPGQVNKDEFAILPAEFWNQDLPLYPGPFWSTGDHNLIIKSHPQRYVNLTGVRFEPEGVEKLRQQLANEMKPEDTAPAKPKNDDRRPPSRDETKRFCRAILSEWPNAPEDWIREKAILFFSDNKVTRDWFREILREIRGPVSRGRPPKKA